MNDNRDATIKDLCRYLIANAPKGAERDLGHMERELAEGIPSYLSLEFRRDNDSCQLYVNDVTVDSDYSGTLDEEGNRWHSTKVMCKVSWPSYGSDDVKTCQRRLDLMQEVVYFASRVEACFSQVLYQMTQSKEEIAANKVKWATEKAVHEVRRLVELNAKGLKVGDGRTVYSGTLKDHEPTGAVEVMRTNGGKCLKYTAYFTSQEGFNFVRTA